MVLEMKEIQFPLTENVRGKNIQKIIYLPDSNKVLIWHNNKPIQVDVDLKSMTKTAENYYHVMSGRVDNNTKEKLLLIMSDGLAPYIFEFVKNGGVYGYGIVTGNDNGDGLTDEYAESLNRASNRTIPKFKEDEIPEIPDRNYAEFIINTVKKEVKRDDVLIRQVLYTGLSTYTFDPQNLAINSPTSEGKTYTTQKVLQYFPEDDVWSIGNMSDKALIRQKGILINSKGESIEKRIDELKDELRNTTRATITIEPKDDDEDKPQMSISDLVERKKAEIKKKLNTLLDDASTLINLQGKIILFLEPPGKGVLNLIKPILSHDKLEISYPYTAKNENSGQWVTRNVIVRGWPSVIFCSTKDESQWETWPEIQSRFLITSTNMNEEKVHDGNLLIAQRKSLPEAIKQKLIVSDKDRDPAKKSVSYLKSWINRLFIVNNADHEHPNIVWIPYHEILANALPHNKGTDNRAANRIFSFLNIVASTKVHHRPNLVYGKERLVIAELEDLGEVLHITQKNISGIPSYKVDFYTDYFTPLYESKIAPDINTKNGKEEDIIAVTTSQLCQYYKQKSGKPITSDSIRKTYLNELINNGYVDYQDSKIDGHQKIYFPIMEMPIKSQEKVDEQNLKESNDSRSFLQHSRLIPSKHFKKIPKNWLELQISALKMSGNDNDVFRIMDKDDNDISIDEFIADYQKDMNLFLLIEEPKIYSFYNNLFGFILYLSDYVQNAIEMSGNDQVPADSVRW
jgi:hypothetical protein